MATAPARGLKRLELADCRRLETSALEWIAAGCTCLNSIVISGCTRATPEAAELLAATPPLLVRLGVAGCVGLGGSVLTFVAERGRGLEHLDISDIPATTAGVVNNFLRNCPRLVSINISGLAAVNSLSFRGLGGGNFFAGDEAPICSRNFEQSRDSTGNKTPSNEQAWRCRDAPELPRLRVARMLRLPGLDDASVIRFATACPKLEEILLSDSPKVTGACLVPLSSLCPLLRSLGLDRCGAASDEPALASALQGLSSLQNLQVACDGHGRVESRSARHSKGCMHESNLAERAPFNGESVRRSINYVESSTTRTDLPPFTGAALLLTASRCCAELSTLGLEGHGQLTFTADHAPPGAFLSLTELRLSACGAVNDKGLLVLLKACPRVRTLSLTGSGVSQDALLRMSSVHRSFVEILPPAPSSVSLTSNSHKTIPAHVEIPPALIRESNLPVTSCKPLLPPSHIPIVNISKRSLLVAEPSGSKPGLAASVGLIDAKQKLGKASGATGLRPAIHCDLYLASDAVFSRLEEERGALAVIVRAFNRFKKTRMKRQVLAGKKICRAMLGHRFKTSNGNPDQVAFLPK